MMLRKNIAKYTNLAKANAKRALVGVGLYEEIPREYNEIVFAEKADYWGDSPVGEFARGYIQTGYNYLRERPDHVTRKDLYYTPIGMAWRNGRIDEMSSFSPLLKPFVQVPYFGAVDVIDRGTVVQSEFTNTYGDWVTEQSRSLALASKLVSPVVLPRHLKDRGYVRHDLERLGVEGLFPERPVRIREAHVLLKRRPGLYWTREDVAAYRARHGIAPPEAKPGSLIFLSRRGVRSELQEASRTFPTDLVADLVERMGGQVFHTGAMGHDDFTALGESAETVIAEHGAAMFNLLQWNTKNVIELITDNWWSGCFVFLGKAAGVENHVLLRVSGKSPEEISARIQELRAQFAAG